jgi:hypothetical protein
MTLADIKDKMRRMFGNTASKVAVQSRFWTQTQANKESVASYATKLEGILNDLRRDHGDEGGALPTEADLRDRFFIGLRRELKEPVRGRYERGCRFDILVDAARKAEQEQRQETSRSSLYVSSKAAQINQTATLDPPDADGEGDSDEDEDEETTTVHSNAAMRSGRKEPGSAPKFPGNKGYESLPGDFRQCHRCKGWGHFAQDCPNKVKVDLNLYEEHLEAGEMVLRRKTNPPKMESGERGPKQVAAAKGSPSDSPQ